MVIWPRPSIWRDGTDRLGGGLERKGNKTFAVLRLSGIWSKHLEGQPKSVSPHLVWNCWEFFVVFHIASKAWVKSHSSNHSEGLYVVIEELRSNTIIQACSLAELDLNSQIKLSVARSCLLATGCCYNNVKVKITVKCSFCLCACTCSQTCLTKCNQCSE